MCDAFLDAKYEQERSENLENYMTAKGVPWLVRKLISGKMEKGYFNLTKQQDGKYKVVLGTPRGNMEYIFQFDEPFIGTGYDGRKHKLTFSMESGVFIEKHEHLEGERKGENNDITEWKFKDGQLIAETPAVDKDNTAVIWTKYFKKI